jgi:hypothetical protein
MLSYLTIGKLVILAAALVILASGRAEAGASASAPSKYARSSQMAAHHQTGHKTAKNDFGITEYSSSSARNR